MTFQKAVREQRPLRMAIFGPSGSGKSLTSLIIAQELAGPEGKIALIDTERSSASHYADNFEFDIALLEAYAHTDYIDLIEQAGQHEVLIIDSISHHWEGKGGILDLVEHVTAGQSGKKDSFRAWADPRVKNAQELLWAAVLGFPGHVIVTMRAKTAYERSTENGKAKIEKLGLAPVQRSGVEFEFDVIAEMDKEHWLEIDKARDPEGKLEGSRIHKPGVEFAQALKAWLDSGSTPAEDYQKRISATCLEIARLTGEKEAVVREKAWEYIKIAHDTNDLGTISNEDLATIPERLMDTLGPGSIEEERQLRQAKKEVEKEKQNA